MEDQINLENVQGMPAPMYQEPIMDPAYMVGYWIGMLVFAIIMIAGMWRVFTKAGQPGWAAVIPFYNIYILLKIVGKPGWWLVLYFVPLVNLIVSIIVALELAKAFGKSQVFGILLVWLLSPIGVLILGFGSAQYKMAKAPAQSASEPAKPEPQAPKAS